MRAGRLISVGDIDECAVRCRALTIVLKEGALPVDLANSDGSSRIRAADRTAGVVGSRASAGEPVGLHALRIC
jgi:hypothetical protein